MTKSAGKPSKFAGQRLADGKNSYLPNILLRQYRR
jgi:hypothetical protein